MATIRQLHFQYFPLAAVQGCWPISEGGCPCASLRISPVGKINR